MKFDLLYKKIVSEDNTAGGGEVFGPGSVSTSLPGSYNDGDARLAGSFFILKRSPLSKKRKKRSKR